MMFYAIIYFMLYQSTSDFALYYHSSSFFKGINMKFIPPPTTNHRRSLRLATLQPQAKQLSFTRHTRSTFTGEHSALPLHPTQHTPHKKLYSQWDRKLQLGCSLGCTPFTSSVAKGKLVKLICRVNNAGHRGLFAAQHFYESQIVALGNGVIQPRIPAILNTPDYKLHNTDDSVVILSAPTTVYPANLANTAGKHGNNNCTILHACHSQIWRLKATKHIAPGQEILTPYGKTFTANINQHALPCPPPPTPPRPFQINPSTLVPCPYCTQNIKTYKLQAHKRMCVVNHSCNKH